MRTILFHGDSVTDGEHPRSHDRYPGYTYPLFVKERLDRQYPAEYCVLNRAVAGFRLADVYAGIKQDIINLQPDVISIFIGTNDVLGFFNGSNNGTEEKKFCRLYRMLLDELREALPDARILLMEPFVTEGRDTAEYYDALYAKLCRYAGMIREIGEEYGLVFVPLQDKFTEAVKQASPEFWTHDGIHPTVEGSALIAREWLNAFSTLE